MTNSDTTDASGDILVGVSQTGTVRTPQLLLPALAVTATAAGAVAWVLLDVVAGRQAFLSGGVFGLAVALVIGTVRWLPLPLRPHPPIARMYVPLVLVRSTGWLLFAAEAALHPLRLPALGDLPTVLQAVAVLYATMVMSPHRKRSRTFRMLFDGVLAGVTVLFALWVAALGVPHGHRVAGVPTVLGLLVCLLVLVETVTVVLVLVRDGGDRRLSGVIGIVLLAAADLRLLSAGLGGGVRGTDRVTVLLWCGGWLAIAWVTCLSRPVPADRRPPDAVDRAERRATMVATAILLGSTLVVLVAGPGGMQAVPGGTTGGLLVAAIACLFAARDVFLGGTRARLMESLRTQATLDPLTGLANRRGLTGILRQVTAGSSEWVVLALDLDGFKAVNDLHGHAVGDEVLVTAADVLRALCPAGGMAARTGGDEFALLCPGDIADGRLLAGRIRAGVEARLRRLTLAPRITVSVGVGRLDPRAGGPSGPGDRLAVLVEAAAALRSAKSGGGNRVEVYPGRVARERERRLLVESRLREALAAGRITTVGQPVVDLRTGRAVTFEALARWDDEVLGTVPPEEFVAVAEETGLVAELGRQVLRSAVVGFRSAVSTGSGVSLAVNVSPVELRLPGCADAMTDILRATGFPAGDLVVEVTEAVVIRAGDPAVRALAELSSLGIQVAIDDFGTGYSALGYLRRLPVQVLKVDRSLLAEALVSERTRQILAGVVDLARRVGLPVVIEGIEDDAGARLARDLGADRGQGYRLGPPVSWSGLARGRLRSAQGLRPSG